MVYFAKDGKIRLVTIALLVGIGAVPDLEQQEDGSYRPVCSQNESGFAQKKKK